MIALKRYSGDDNTVLEVQKDLHEYIKKLENKYPLNFQDPIVFKNIILADGKRSFKDQEKRLALLPSFENEIVLDVECDTGFITREIAKTARYCIGTSQDGGIVTIPKYILNKNNIITNVEFHELSNINWLQRNNNKGADTLLLLHTQNVFKIFKTLPRFMDLCNKRIILETVIDPESKKNNIKKITNNLNNFGETSFLGYTGYEDKGLFQIKKVKNKKIIVQKEGRFFENASIKDLVDRIYKNQKMILNIIREKESLK